MKKNSKILLVLGLLIMYAGLIFAANNQEVFLRANQQYEFGNYQESLDLYASIEKKGSSVWHNMGNCAYRLHNYSWALVYWLRALPGSSTVEYKAIMHNIDLIDESIGKTGSHFFGSGMYLFLYTLFHSFSLLFLQLLCIISWFVLLFLHKKRFKKLAHNFCLLFVICILIVSGVGVFIKYNQNYYEYGVVFAEKQDVFVGPHVDYDVLTQLSEADVVMVCEKRPGWYKVKAGTLVGWVLANSVEVV